MKIEYTDYAEETILDRMLNKKYIEETLLEPDHVIEGKYGRKIAHKVYGTKLLRVIYEIDTKAYIVITAYFTTPQRYMHHEN